MTTIGNKGFPRIQAARAGLSPGAPPVSLAKRRLPSARGQGLLQPGEVGIRSTGIGCFFDDPVFASTAWQRFYHFHFTVGGPVEYPRLTTLPAYGRGIER